MTYTREIDLYPAAGGSRIKSLADICRSASFTLTSGGGCAGATFEFATVWRQRSKLGIVPGMIIRCRWSTEHSHCYSGVVSTVDHSLESDTTSVACIGPATRLDSLFACDAEELDPETGELPETVDFGTDATDHPEITTLRDLMLYYLDELVVPETILAYEAEDIADEDSPVTIPHLVFRRDQELSKVFDDIALMMGAAGDVFRWGVKPGANPLDPDLVYLTRISSFATAVATFYIGDTSFSTDLDRVIGLKEGLGADVHNVVNLTGGVKDSDNPLAAPSLLRLRVEDTDSITSYGRRRAARVLRTCLVEDVMATKWAQGYLARYALPETFYRDLRAVPSESTGIPFPWSGKLQLRDMAAGDVRFEEFSSVTVAWDDYPTLAVTLGRITDEQPFSEADGTVISPNSLLQLALNQFDDPMTLFGGDGGGGTIPIPPPTGAVAAGLAIGTVFGAVFNRVIEPGERVMWHVLVAHHGDLAALGDVVVEYAFRASGAGAWGTPSTRVIGTDDRIGSSDQFDQRVGPRAAGVDQGPTFTSAGEVAWRLIAKDAAGATLSENPASSEPEDWPRVVVIDFETSPPAITVRNVFPGIWTT